MYLSIYLSIVNPLTSDLYSVLFRGLLGHAGSQPSVGILWSANDFDFKEAKVVRPGAFS